MVSLSGKCPKNFHKDLKIELTRLPFHDFTNKTMMSLRQSASPKRRLRKCQQKNYFESTLEPSIVIEDEKVPSSRPSSSIVKPKIPIYKQNVSTLVSTENKKQGKDPYEFDISDSKKGKPRGKQKNMKLNDSRKFNKTMYDVLEKLEKVNRKPRKKTSKTKPLKPPGEYEKNINNSLKKAMNKINERKKIQGDKAKLVKNKSVHDTENMIHHGDENNTGVLGLNALQHPLEVGNMLQTPISRINIISDVELTTHNSPIGHCNDESNGNNLDSDKFFGFSDDDNINPVSKSMESPALFAQRRPNANSTMIGNRSKSPWRVTTFLTRKPYLLSVKNSALPNLQQEMILDHSLVVDIDKHHSQSVLEASNPKLPVQTTMLDYVVSSVDHTMEHNQENVAHSSLFNYEEFNVAKPKRRVLGTLQECSLNNRQAVSTPIPGIHMNMSPNMSAIDGDGESKIFGFETTGFSMHKENHFSKAKPYRLNLAGIKMNKNSIPDENSEDDSTLVFEEEGSNEDISIKMSREHNTDVHLFDDIEKEFDGEMTIQLPVLQYQRKARRKRLQSDASDGDDEETKPKKKKKDMMTKAEEAAFEKWASEFNSMCDEVDKHHLEIE